MDRKFLDNPALILKEPIPGFADPANIILECLFALLPPLRIKISEAAEKYRVLDNKGGGIVGRWSNDVTPYLVEPGDMLTNRKFDGVIFAGPAQSGKTDGLILNAIGYRVTCDPGDMLIIQTSETVSRDFVPAKIDPMHKASFSYRNELLSGVSNDNSQRKNYKSGMTALFGWPTDTWLSGKTIPWVLMTDYDRFPRDINKQGEAFFLGLKRTQTLGSRGICLAESSPGEVVTDGRWKKEPGSHQAPPTNGGIMMLYNLGDRRRWQWPCPNCKQFFEGTWDEIKYPAKGSRHERADGVYMECPCCEYKIQQSQRYEMNMRGIWVPEGCHVTVDGELKGEPLRSEFASYWMNGTAAAFQTWRELVLRYLAAVEAYRSTGEESALKTTVNVDRGCPYVPSAIREEKSVSKNDLQKRAEDYKLGVVPEGVRFLVAFADVQKDKFVVQVVGFGRDRERWLVDRFDINKSNRVGADGEMIDLDPAGYEEDWQALVELMILAKYPLDDGSGRKMAVRLSGVDSGGKAGVTEKAYTFWRKMKLAGLGKKFLLVKGSGTSKARFKVSYPDSNRKDRKAKGRGEIPIHILGTNVLKSSVWGDLCREDIGPGYVHHSNDLSDGFFAELVAERYDPKKGWYKLGRAKNESFDLHVYAHFGFIYLKADKFNWSDVPDWAKPWDENSLVSSIGQPTPTSSGKSDLEKLKEIMGR